MLPLSRCGGLSSCWTASRLPLATPAVSCRGPGLARQHPGASHCRGVPCWSGRAPTRLAPGHLGMSLSWRAFRGLQWAMPGGVDCIHRNAFRLGVTSPCRGVPCQCCRTPCQPRPPCHPRSSTLPAAQRSQRVRPAVCRSAAAAGCPWRTLAFAQRAPCPLRPHDPAPRRAQPHRAAKAPMTLPAARLAIRAAATPAHPSGPPAPPPGPRASVPQHPLPWPVRRARLSAPSPAPARPARPQPGPGRPHPPPWWCRACCGSCRARPPETAAG
mmetsp:Transcript_19293/g.60539  ORF Transcript_19293/g.60539 Transcript_19293/m.60539 type:complete len:271 (-) Transcript_19293:302-1114(-)